MICDICGATPKEGPYTRGDTALFLHTWYVHGRESTERLVNMRTLWRKASR